MKVFSYGSNMLTERLTAKNRAPGALPSCIGCVHGHALRFHKKSIDGSGKCDMHYTGVVNDVVWGVVFEVPNEEMNQLRDAEGSGKGYHESLNQVELAVGSTESIMAFVADATAINPSLQPYTWYQSLVVAGAEEHGLPEAYIATLRVVTASLDPRADRPAKVEAEDALRRYRERCERLR